MTREPAPAHIIAAAEQDYQAMRQTLAAFIPTVRALLAELPTEVEAVTEVWLTLVSQDRRAAAMLAATAIVQLARTSSPAAADGCADVAPSGQHQPVTAPLTNTGRPGQAGPTNPRRADWARTARDNGSRWP